MINVNEPRKKERQRLKKKKKRGNELEFMTENMVVLLLEIRKSGAEVACPWVEVSV